MKGKLENALIALSFPHLIIFRPPLLIRPDSDRLGEKIAKRIFNALNRIGLLKNQRPLAVEKLAQAMLNTALKLPEKSVRIYEPKDIFNLLNVNP